MFLDRSRVGGKLGRRTHCRTHLAHNNSCHHFFAVLLDRARVQYLAPWLRGQCSLEIPWWRLPVVIWHRPQGRDEDGDEPQGRDQPHGRDERGRGGGAASGSAAGSGTPRLPNEAPNPKDRVHPIGAGADWKGWRERNPGLPRRSAAGANAREKAKEGIMEDGWINLLVEFGSYCVINSRHENGDQMR